MAWQEHRLVAVVAAGLVFLGVQEHRTPGVGNMESPTPPASLLDRVNIVDVYSELYPDRTSSHYFRALRAYLCLEPEHRRKPACRPYVKRAPAMIRSHLENAVEAGNRSNEKVAYNYALALIAVGAPQEEIDAVIRQWRIDHPYSGFPDPRDFRGQRGDPSP